MRLLAALQLGHSLPPVPPRCPTPKAPLFATLMAPRRCREQGSQPPQATSPKHIPKHTPKRTPKTLPQRTQNTPQNTSFPQTLRNTISPSKATLPDQSPRILHSTSARHPPSISLNNHPKAHHTPKTKLSTDKQS